jgi:hypothetical protein
LRPPLALCCATERSSPTSLAGIFGCVHLSSHVCSVPCSWLLSTGDSVRSTTLPALHWIPFSFSSFVCGRVAS